MAKKIINVEDVLNRYGEAKTNKSRTDNERREAGKYVWPAAQDQVRTPMSKDDTPRTVEK